MRSFRVSVGIAVAVFLTVGAAPLAAPAAAPPEYFVDESKLPFEALPGTTTDRLWGVHNGAGYRIEVPANWNGELVLYAHGFRGTGLELTVTDPSIREYLVNNGFAWAASSYSKNGYDVKQGVKDTHALGVLFRGLVGNPRRTYLMGHSMGGHITGVAIEQYPAAYAGALPMCGVMGDVELFDFFLDYNLLAQALADWPAEFPAPADYLTRVVPAVKTALGAPFPASLNSEGEKLKAATELLTGGDRPTFDLGWTVWNANDFLFGLGVGDGTVWGGARSGRGEHRHGVPTRRRSCVEQRRGRLEPGRLARRRRIHKACIATGWPTSRRCRALRRYR